MRSTEKFSMGFTFFGSMIGVFASEFLIFYNPEARADCLRMWPCAVFSPFMFGGASMFFSAGVAALILVPVFFVKYVFQNEDDELKNLRLNCLVAGGGIASGGTVITYWIYSIIIEGCPAFGYNADNVYAVVGINTMILFIPAAMLGMIGMGIGYILFGLSFFIGFFVRTFNYYKKKYLRGY